MTTDAWELTIGWQSLSDKTETDVYTHSHLDHGAAYKEGRSLCCCAGAVIVTIKDPDGVIVHEWDRESNLWRTHQDDYRQVIEDDYGFNPFR